MSNPTPPTFNYSNLSFTVTLVGNQFIFTFTIPTKPGLQLSNPIYVNALNMTVEKDRFNANLVELGDDKGVYTLNYLNQVPPAGSLNAFINALLALIPLPSPPVVVPSPAFIARHTPDLSASGVDYLAAPYVRVMWDTIIQNSTDVTYNAGTQIFTGPAADYLVTYYFQGNPYTSFYLGVVRDEGTGLNLVQTLSVPNSVVAVQYNPPVAIIPGGNYLWGDTGTCTWISEVVPFAAGATFSLGVESDPNQTTVFTYLADGTLIAGDPVYDRKMTSCSIKRLL